MLLSTLNSFRSPPANHLGLSAGKFVDISNTNAGAMRHFLSKNSGKSKESEAATSESISDLNRSDLASYGTDSECLPSLQLDISAESSSRCSEAASGAAALQKSAKNLNCSLQSAESSPKINKSDQPALSPSSSKSKLSACNSSKSRLSPACGSIINLFKKCAKDDTKNSTCTNNFGELSSKVLMKSSADSLDDVSIQEANDSFLRVQPECFHDECSAAEFSQILDVSNLFPDCNESGGAAMSRNCTEASAVEASESSDPVASDSDWMRCERCGSSVLIWEMPEHTDYHFALDLQNEQAGEGSRLLCSDTKKPSMKKLNTSGSNKRKCPGDSSTQKTTKKTQRTGGNSSRKLDLYFHKSNDS